MNRFMRDAERIALKMMMRNQVGVMRGLSSLVALVAVADDKASGQADERSAPIAMA